MTDCFVEAAFPPRIKVQVVYRILESGGLQRYIGVKAKDRELHTGQGGDFLIPEQGNKDAVVGNHLYLQELGIIGQQRNVGYGMVFAPSGSSQNVDVRITFLLAKADGFGQVVSFLTRGGNNAFPESFKKF